MVMRQQRLTQYSKLSGAAHGEPRRQQYEQPRQTYGNYAGWGNGNYHNPYRGYGSTNRGWGGYDNYSSYGGYSSPYGQYGSPYNQHGYGQYNGYGNHQYGGYGSYERSPFG